MSSCASMRLYALLDVPLNPPQPPTPSQGGTSDSNERVRAPRFPPANHKNCRRALVCAICLPLDSLTLSLNSPQQIIMQLGPPASRAGFALSCSAKLLGQWTISLYLMKLHAVWLVPWALSEQKIMLNRRLLGRLPAASYRPLSKRRLLPSRLLAIKIRI